MGRTRRQHSLALFKVRIRVRPTRHLTTAFYNNKVLLLKLFSPIHNFTEWIPEVGSFWLL